MKLLKKLRQNQCIFAQMKNLLIIVAAVLLSTVSLLAQDGTLENPQYLQNPTLPSFEILLEDSTTMFNTKDIPTGKPTVLMYFSPDCDHCALVVRKIKEHNKDFKKAHIYMSTPMSLAATKEFSKELEIDKMDNITIGKDHAFFVIKYYKITSFPFLAVYDSNKQLVGAFHANADFNDVVKAVKNAD